MGAKIGGAGNAETFGLSTLSGIFGRLNGKSDGEVQKQAGHLRDAELRTYQAQKYGFMNFVSGGLLIGDKIEEVRRDALPSEKSVVTVKKPEETVRSSKKRKAEDVTDEPIEGKRLKKKKEKSIDTRVEIATAPVSEKAQGENPSTAKLSKDGERQSAADESVQAVASEPSKILPQAVEDGDSKDSKEARKAARKAERAARRTDKEGSSDDKARLKQEKRARKEERRKRKEEKRQRKAAKPEKVDNGPALPTPSSGVSTPTLESLAFGGSRHAVRQRYILQKRMASLDPQALKEILMIKAPA